ncbi:MAG: two-component system sensor histidine kinase CreC [Desulfobulbus propionicus]|nr:MAG: two-component system sensor histidine kinase CreC [Desulfobulbus propionicus]
MKLGSRIFACSLLLLSLCLYYPINAYLGTLRTRYLEGVEDPLVDQANILAELAGREMASGRFTRRQWHNWFDKIARRNPDARIYSLLKQGVDQRIYITDAGGKLLFDSSRKDPPGSDYSDWRNIHLTLQGKYGTRTTKTDPSNAKSSVLHVSAPIYQNREITGVLTVAKPTGNIWYFLRQAKLRILATALASLAVAAAFSYALALWLTRPMSRLTRYALDIARGRQPPRPKLDSSEIGVMGQAFFQMQDALEGTHYVEQYIQNLTHELKSPLSAIRGAAELLTEPMPQEQQQRFLANIRSEALRLQQVIDRMLELSSLENRKEPLRKETIAVQSLLANMAESAQCMLQQKGLQLSLPSQVKGTVQGDCFLLNRALSNLLTNAIEFSPEGGTIAIKTDILPGLLAFVILDQGPGIPDFAGERIFEKFYSLERPATGKKSTGLGLSFVRQVALLHGGEVHLENRHGQGTCARLSLPLDGISCKP